MASVDGQTVFHFRARAEFPDIFHTCSHSASFAGAERTDFLPAEIKMLQEGKYRHRHGAAVTGISQKYLVIISDTLRESCKLRAGVLFFIFYRFSNTLLIFRRIGTLHLDPEQVRSCQLLKLLRRNFRIPHFHILHLSAEIILVSS